MNFVTVMPVGGEDVIEAFIDACEKYCDDLMSDTLYIITSRSANGAHPERFKRLKKCFERVIVREFPLQPLDVDNEAYISDMCLTKVYGIGFDGGDVCVIPFGWIPSKAGWQSAVSDGRKLSAPAEWCGMCENPSPPNGQGIIMVGPFCCPAINLRVNPMFRLFTKEASLAEKLEFYVKRSFAEVEMPFRFVGRLSLLDEVVDGFKLEEKMREQAKMREEAEKSKNEVCVGIDDGIGFDVPAEDPDKEVSPVGLDALVAEMSDFTDDKPAEPSKKVTQKRATRKRARKVAKKATKKKAKQ
jgi:hypothetical protein